MLTFADYTKLGYNTVPEAEFPKYLIRAYSYLEYITFNKVNRDHPKRIQDKVNVSLCEVMDILFEHEEKVQSIKRSDKAIISKGLKSETVKSHTASFRDATSDTQTELLKATEVVIYSLLKRMLLPTGLLYRGL